MTKHQISPKNSGERNRDINKIRDYDRKSDRPFLSSDKVGSDRVEDEENDDARDSSDLKYAGGFGDDFYSTERFDASTQTDQLSRVDSLEAESAILVGVYLPGQGKEADPLAELAGLAEAAEVKVVGRLIQRRVKPDNACYLGSGKVEELQEIISSTNANVILFDNDLAPGQTRNLEQKLKTKVLDRTELILDIFASRAQTYEACLAVELAQLEYSMPRLRRMWTHLERQAGGGVGLRGPGEKQLEVDRRIAQKKIAALKEELDRIHQRKQREVKGRSSSKTVCLVGYTNAGKSTILNTLTNADVFAKDLLFATLDTRTKRWTIPGWGPILLSDTVGFIRDLPHHLVASFRATLEEATSADLLIHVADAGNPQADAQIKSAFDVLNDIGIREKDTILVLNKIDSIESPDRLAFLQNEYPLAIPVSAKTREGLDKLTAAVSDALSREFKTIYVEASVANGKVTALLARDGEILSREYTGEQVLIRCRVPERIVGKLLKDPEISVRDENNQPFPPKEDHF